MYIRVAWRKYQYFYRIKSNAEIVLKGSTYAFARNKNSFPVSSTNSIANNLYVNWFFMRQYPAIKHNFISNWSKRFSLLNRTQPGHVVR